MRPVFLLVVLSCLAALVAAVPISLSSSSRRDMGSSYDLVRRGGSQSKTSPEKKEVTVTFIKVDHERKEVSKEKFTLKVRPTTFKPPVAVGSAEVFEVVSGRRYKGNIMYRFHHMDQQGLDDFKRKTNDKSYRVIAVSQQLLRPEYLVLNVLTDYKDN